MRVLLVNNYHEVRGGSERVYHETGRLLEAAGHEVFYCSTVDAPGVQRGPNVLLLPRLQYEQGGVGSKLARSSRFIYSRENARELREFVLRVRPDVAHLHIFYGHLTNAVLSVLRDCNVPIAMSVHEYRLLCPAYTMLDRDGHQCDQCSAGNYAHAVRKRCIKGSYARSALAAAECLMRDRFFGIRDAVAHFIMVSEFIRQTHVDHDPRFLERSSVLHNFVRAAADPGDARAPGYLLYFGRLSREKGLHRLLSAASELEVPIVVAGEGPDGADLRVKFESAPNVQFVGFVSGDPLRRLVREARFACVPSEWFENNPMSILEAMAAGTPVIASRIGGIPELVDDGETGWLFDAGSDSALRHAITKARSLSEAGYARMRAAALASARMRFSPETHLQGLLEVYGRLTAERGAPSRPS